MEYTPEEAAALAPKIRPDGTVESPGVMTVEEAMKLGGANGQPPVEDPNKPPVEGATEGAEKPPVEGATDDNPDKPPAEAGKTGIELDTEDPPITVGGITKPTSTWLKEMEDEYNVDSSVVPTETRQKMLDGYINTKHKAEWQKVNTVKAQQSAEERKVAENLRRDAEIKLRQAEAAKMATQQIQQRLSQEKARLAKVAESTIDANSIKNEQGEVDPQKQYEFNKVLMARDRLREIDSEMGELDQQLAKAEIDRTVVEIQAFQAEHPEYITGEPLLAVIQKVESQGMKDHPDVSKLLDIYDILDYARSRGVPLAMAHERLATQGKLSVKGATMPAAATPPAPKLPDNKSAAQQKVVAAIKNKQNAAQPALDGAGGIPSRPALAPKATIADKMREASARATGGANNTALDKMGY